jgi:hypothetical protein
MALHPFLGIKSGYDTHAPARPITDAFIGKIAIGAPSVADNRLRHAG